MNPRLVLNKMKWKNNLKIEDAEIWYIHRGAPKDTRIISGREIVKLHKSFMETNSAMIPYHRIFKIIYNGNIVFNR